jgi:hypothetical protein
VEVCLVAVPDNEELAIIDHVIYEPSLVVGDRLLDDDDKAGFRGLLDVTVFIKL